MGLCGGMSFLARDIHESGTPQLRSTSSRSIPLPLGRHILTRLLDSFVGPGVIPYWIHATQELDHGTWFWGKGLYAETVDAARTGEALRRRRGAWCPSGWSSPRAPGRGTSSRTMSSWSTGTTSSTAELTLHVYDSNYEGSDNVTITLDIGSSAPARPILTNGTSMPGRSGHIRGLFVLPYQRKDPSPAYVDDGQVTFAGTVPTSVTPGETRQPVGDHRQHRLDDVRCGPRIPPRHAVSARQHRLGNGPVRAVRERGSQGRGLDPGRCPFVLH
jgi:hypothetical protein